MTSEQLRSGGLRCLVLGIRGAGMTAAAEILRDAGHQVFGLDEGVDNSAGATSNRSAAELISGNSELPPGLDLCITSRAFTASHPLLRRLTKFGVEILSLPIFLSRIFDRHRQICIAGTHGKSTTAAMVTWILQQAGFDPSSFVGAQQCVSGASGRFTSSDVVVIESCEFLRSFLEFSPDIALITGIERDHFDCFPDQQSEDAAFNSFAQRIKPNGVLVTSADCVRSQNLVTRCSARQVTFRSSATVIGHDASSSGMNMSADGQIRDVILSGLRSRCQVQISGEWHNLKLMIPGRHNLQNALSAIVVAAQLGISPNISCVELARFPGIRRRFEIRGDYGGVTLVDDYAHHPTAIRETIQTARAAFPGRRLIVVFEPHQIVRIESLFEEFVDSLVLADEVLVLPVFAARENATALECCRASGRVVKELNRRGHRSFLFANLDQTVARVDHSARPSDVLLTLGAGRTNLIHDELTRRLQRHSVA